MLSRFGTSQLAVAGVLLVGFGLVMVYSASAARSEVVFGTTLAYLGKQTLALALGLAVGALCFWTPLAWLERLGLAAWGVSVLALAAAYATASASVSTRSTRITGDSTRARSSADSPNT